jgi:starch phosphorylase
MDGEERSMKEPRRIAYFSMEIGLLPSMPTYSGGLGVLAGDTIRSAADLELPMVGVTLLHRKGYFYQRLDASGWQTEEAVNWSVDDFLADTGQRASVVLEGRTVQLRAWRRDVSGLSGSALPVFFLDTDLPENSPQDRNLTHFLYGGDSRDRLCQEVILGIGGVRMLRALGYDEIRRYHMNEGHSALLTIELLRERREQEGRDYISPEDLEAVRRQCVFTTHTPVPAGHDKFPLELVDQVLGSREACGIDDPICHEERLNMTYLALSLSHYVNGVAKKHGEISRHMFAQYQIDAITNGVHVPTWISPSFRELFDRYIAGWEEDNFSLRYALGLPDDEVWAAHESAKRRLVDFVNREVNAGLDVDVLTLGFARRAATYKRADLIFRDVERLRHIAGQHGGLQLVFAGKAHPADQEGKELIQRVVQIGRSLADSVAVAYLPNYDMELAGILTAGVDVWLNTPQRPLEASGTSGMKAALNGVPSLSVLDGWWIEGCIEGVTGWAIGTNDAAPDEASDREQTTQSLYEKLEQAVVPLFYANRPGFIEIMRHAIALNGSFFNTQRMVAQYAARAYLR